MTIAETMKAAQNKRAHVVLKDGTELKAMIAGFMDEVKTGMGECAIRIGEAWGILEHEIKSIQILS